MHFQTNHWFFPNQTISNCYINFNRNRIPFCLHPNSYKRATRFWTWCGSCIFTFGNPLHYMQPHLGPDSISRSGFNNVSNSVVEIRQSQDHLISTLKSVTIYHSGCGVSVVVADGLEPICSISGHHNATNFCTCHDSTAVVPWVKSCSDFARICGHN